MIPLHNLIMQQCQPLQSEPLDPIELIRYFHIALRSLWLSHPSPQSCYFPLSGFAPPRRCPKTTSTAWGFVCFSYCWWDDVFFLPNSRFIKQFYPPSSLPHSLPHGHCSGCSWCPQSLLLSMAQTLSLGLRGFYDGKFYKLKIKKFFLKPKQGWYLFWSK